MSLLAVSISVNSILYAVLIVGGVGLFIGIALGIAGKFLSVEVDEKEVAIREALPGNNCGGCGYPGCDGLAAAIASGESEPSACPVGGAPVAKKIADILGVEAEVVPKVAYVSCSGDCDKAKDKYNYYGNMSCQDAANIPGGGAKACSYGCLGLGSCVKACEFDAIHIVNGKALVDREKCKACGKCVAKCPRHLIELIPYDQKVAVDCSSHDKGKQVMAACEIGCIGCKKCEKVCKFEAIIVENAYPVIDYDKCKSCGLCAKECPRGCIENLRKPKVVAPKPEPVKEKPAAEE
mgnify:CR=1 FL=1